jgi:hypothetical protein
VPTTLDELVALSIAERRGVIEELVREQVEEALRRAVQTLVDDELEARRNGRLAPPAEEPPPIEEPPPLPATSRKVCRVCGEEKPLDAFGPDPRQADGHRGTCTACRREQASRRRSTRRAAKAAEEQPARQPLVRGRGLGGPRSQADVDVAARARAQIEDARRNGVTTELVDGRAFRVLHLPSVERELVSARAPIVPHAHARAIALPG